jgi:hypothetical protein
MSEFRTKITDFFEKMIARNNASGFVNEVTCYLPDVNHEPVDLSDDEYVMEHVVAYFGSDAVCLKAIAVEKDRSGGGSREFVIELTESQTSENAFIKIAYDKIPQCSRGNSFCVEFRRFEFVQPFKDVVTTFK